MYFLWEKRKRKKKKKKWLFFTALKTQNWSDSKGLSNSESFQGLRSNRGSLFPKTLKMAATTQLAHHLECYVDTARPPAEQVHLPSQFLLLKFNSFNYHCNFWTSLPAMLKIHTLLLIMQPFSFYLNLDFGFTFFLCLIIDTWMIMEYICKLLWLCISISIYDNVWVFDYVIALVLRVWSEKCVCIAGCKLEFHHFSCEEGLVDYWSAGTIKFWFSIVTFCLIELISGL